MQPINLPHNVLTVAVQQGWLSSFLKIYIRVLQQASDLDDMVEDKLLIGDRPKPHPGFDNLRPVRDRVCERSQEELDEVCAQQTKPVLD